MTIVSVCHQTDFRWGRRLVINCTEDGGIMVVVAVILCTVVTLGEKQLIPVAEHLGPVDGHRVVGVHWIP
jgi:hypothetical protein